MSKYKPLLLALAGCSLLSGCMPPVQQTPAMQPVLRVGQAGNRAAEWNQLARYHHERGQLNLALGAYAQSLALDAQQLEARNAVAVIEAQQGRLDAARQALIALVADYPAEAQPHTNLGYVYYLQGEHAAARQALTRAMALGGGPKAFQNLQLVDTADHLAQDATQDAAAASTALGAAPARSPAPATSATATATTAAADATARATATVPAAATSATPASSDAQATPAAPAARADVAPSIPEPAQIASRMELVQLAPHLFELKARSQAPAAPRTPAAAPSAAPSAAPAAAQAAAVTRASQGTAIASPAPAASVTGAMVAALPAATARSKPNLARIEVANGNGVTGMAKRFRSLLGQMGIPVDRISNDKPYKQEITTIQYSPGFEQHAASLQKALQGKAQLASRQLQSSDVRLVLGKDAAQSLAAVGEASLQLAGASGDNE